MSWLCSERFSAWSLGEDRSLLIDILEQACVKYHICLIHAAFLHLLWRPVAHLFSQEILIILQKQSANFLPLVVLRVMILLHLFLNEHIVSLFSVVHVNFELIIFHLLEEELAIVHSSFHALKCHSIHFFGDRVISLVERLFQGFVWWDLRILTRICILKLELNELLALLTALFHRMRWVHSRLKQACEQVVIVRFDGRDGRCGLSQGAETKWLRSIKITAADRR